MPLWPGPYLTSAQGGIQHPGDHDELYELLAEMDAWRNVAAEGGLQQAHDALPAGGGTIWVPPGYNLTPTSGVSITKTCAIVMGHGSKISHGGTTGFFDLISVGSGVDGFALIGSGTIDGRYPTRTGGGVQLLLNGCTRAWVQGIRFINGADMMIATEAATDVWITSNRFFTGNAGGIKCGGQNRAVEISGNRFDTFQAACIFFDTPGAGNSQQDVTVASNKFRTTQRAGTAGKAAIQTFGNGAASEEWFRRFTIVGNDIFNTVTPPGGTGDLVGIGLDQIGDSTISGNHVVNSGVGEGIIVNGPRNRIIGNEVYNAAASGIGLLSYGNGCQVKDCVVANNVVRGNNTTSGQGISIVAAASAGNAVTGLLIIGNRCFENGYGIQSYNNGGTLAGSNNFITGNNLVGNVQASGAASFVSGTGQITTGVNNPTI